MICYALSRNGEEQRGTETKRQRIAVNRVEKEMTSMEKNELRRNGLEKIGIETEMIGMDMTRNGFDRKRKDGRGAVLNRKVMEK